MLEIGASDGERFDVIHGRELKQMNLSGGFIKNVWVDSLSVPSCFDMVETFSIGVPMRLLSSGSMRFPDEIVIFFRIDEISGAGAQQGHRQCGHGERKNIFCHFRIHS